MEQGSAVVPIWVPVAWLCPGPLSLSASSPTISVQLWLWGARRIRVKPSDFRDAIQNLSCFAQMSCELLHSALQGNLSVLLSHCSAEVAAWVFLLGLLTQTKALTLNATLGQGTDAAGKNSPLSLLLLSHAESEIKKPFRLLLVALRVEWQQVQARGSCRLGAWGRQVGWGWLEKLFLGDLVFTNPLLPQVGRHHFGVGKLMH